jgi:hypothetical protein
MWIQHGIVEHGLHRAAVGRNQNILLFDDGLVGVEAK